MAELPRRDFSLVGVSHKAAPVEVREKLAIATAELPGVLAELRAIPGVDELMLLSTCNRVEAYVFGAPNAGASVRGWLVRRAGAAVGPVLREWRGAEVIRHLFRVAASLDSMIVGEPQILGQVKEAFGVAQHGRILARELNRACQAAFVAAKRVRTETAIGSAPVSMASAAMELARKIFGTLDGRTVLLVGAGKMSELAARHLSGIASRIVVTNRTYARAEDLARRVGGMAQPFDRLPKLLVEADIVVSSTAAPRPVITVPMLHAAVKARHWRPLFLVDLAVPRDVEEGASGIESVYSYDVDDLEQVVHDGRAAREAEARKAETIVNQEVERFLKARLARDAVPVLALLRSRAEAIAREEAERTLAQFGEGLTERQRKSIEAMGRAIVNKLLHGPTLLLREAGKRGPEEVAGLAQTVSQLFDLDLGPKAEAAPAPKDAAGQARLPVDTRNRREPA